MGQIEELATTSEVVGGSFDAWKEKQAELENKMAELVTRDGNGSASSYILNSNKSIKLPVKALNLTIDRVKAMASEEIEIEDWNKFLKLEFIKNLPFFRMLSTYDIDFKTAYDFMVKDKGPAPMAKEGAEKLASVLISLAPMLNGAQLFEVLEQMMLEHKEKAIAIADN